MLATLYFTLREISPMGQTGYNGKGGRGGKGALVIEEARNEDEEGASEQEGVCVCVGVCVHASVCKQENMYAGFVVCECVYGVCKCIALHKILCGVLVFFVCERDVYAESRP